MILDYKYPFFSSLKPTTIEKRGGVFSSLFTKHLRENPTN
jgi:hypothetical protein